MIKTLRGIIAGAALLAASSAFAATDTFGTLLSGTGTAPQNLSFASLSYTNVGNVYNFTLSAADLNTLFTTGAFIGAIAVDTAAAKPGISNITGDAPVAAKNGGGPSGIWDFRFDLTGPQQARLTANESVSWTSTFSTAPDLDSGSFALHVQGLTTAQGGSAWYTFNKPVVSTVPEANTYAMMAFGLGLMGFLARRRGA